MKKLIFLLVVLSLVSCYSSNDSVIEKPIEIVPKNVEVRLTTTRPDYDEIVVSYFDFDISDWVYGPMQFEYEIDGSPKPIIISFPDYKYDKIEGNAYRNNDLPYGLNAKIFINEELVLEQDSIGSTGIYASVSFEYTF